MVSKDTMELLEKLGFGADIDALETYVGNMQEAAGSGNPIVTDAVYDTHFSLLKQLKPESELLKRNWEVDDNELTEYDDVLKQYGMCSITTITEYSELYKFKAVLESIGHPIDLIASVKENGHAARAVYLNGRLYNGSTRGRYKKGRDITRHLKAVLPNYVEAWVSIPIVEVRGEMLVSISNFEAHLKNVLKTPLSSVTSLIRDSVSDAELKLLDMVCYKVLSSDGSLEFKSLSDEFNSLQEYGFKVPQHAVMQEVTPENLQYSVERLLKYFETKMDNGEVQYSCDGLVMAINDTDLFYSLGKNGNSWNSNFAVKMGKYWESNIYSAVIEQVVFMPGKSYMTPKAVIEPVVTANGSSVTSVPLYNIGVMERYGYTPGETLYFRYGGETGVSLVDVYGNSCSVNG